MASWDVTLTRSVALGASDEKQVIKVRYTFVFKQRFNVCSETRSDFILNMDAVLSLKRKSNQQWKTIPRQQNNVLLELIRSEVS